MSIKLPKTFEKLNIDFFKAGLKKENIETQGQESVFRALDANNDGVLSETELEKLDNLDFSKLEDFEGELEITKKDGLILKYSKDDNEIKITVSKDNKILNEKTKDISTGKTVTKVFTPDGKTVAEEIEENANTKIISKYKAGVLDFQETFDIKTEKPLEIIENASNEDKKVVTTYDYDGNQTNEIITKNNPQTRKKEITNNFYINDIMNLQTVTDENGIEISSKGFNEEGSWKKSNGVQTNYDKKGNKLSQTNDNQNEVQYDGNGNTYIIVQNGEILKKLAQNLGFQTDAQSMQTFKEKLTELNPDIKTDANGNYYAGEKILIPGELDLSVVKNRKSQAQVKEKQSEIEKQKAQEKVIQENKKAIEDYNANLKRLEDEKLQKQEPRQQRIERINKEKTEAIEAIKNVKQEIQSIKNELEKYKSKKIDSFNLKYIVPWLIDAMGPYTHAILDSDFGKYYMGMSDFNRSGKEQTADAVMKDIDKTLEKLTEMEIEAMNTDEEQWDNRSSELKSLTSFKKYNDTFKHKLDVDTVKLKSNFINDFATLHDTTIAPQNDPKGEKFFESACRFNLLLEDPTVKEALKNPAFIQKYGTISPLKIDMSTSNIDLYKFRNNNATQLSNNVKKLNIAMQMLEKKKLGGQTYEQLQNELKETRNEAFGSNNDMQSRYESYMKSQSWPKEVIKVAIQTYIAIKLPIAGPMAPFIANFIASSVVNMFDNIDEMLDDNGNPDMVKCLNKFVNNIPTALEAGIDAQIGGGLDKLGKYLGGMKLLEKCVKVSDLSTIKNVVRISTITIGSGAYSDGKSYLKNGGNVDMKDAVITLITTSTGAYIQASDNTGKKITYQVAGAITSNTNSN